MRLVSIRDPEGGFEPQALLCTDLEADPERIVSWYVMRAAHVATGSKDKQEKQPTRPVLVPREFCDRFRELIRPLRYFMSTIPMQDRELRTIGVLGSSSRISKYPSFG
jgi:hypothetical protein